MDVGTPLKKACSNESLVLNLLRLECCGQSVVKIQKPKWWLLLGDIQDCMEIYSKVIEKKIMTRIGNLLKIPLPRLPWELGCKIGFYFCLVVGVWQESMGDIS